MRRVLEGAVWVLEEGAVVAGIIVLLPAPDYLLLDNIAISPARQGLGLGRRLLAFAEAEALRLGYSEIRLYTRDAARRPAMTASSCASSLADDDAVGRFWQRTKSLR
jgi:GNAT superfamily N-acetyltransferase